MPSCFPIAGKTTLEHYMMFNGLSRSVENPKRVLIVMDGLKDFSTELLEWVLKNFTFRDCCTITLLGVTPWLNIPLYAKTWSEIWSMDYLEDLSIVKDKIEWKNDPKYQKVQRLVDLCQQYGVVPEIRSEMGLVRLLVVEQITSLHATLVVFDRHHDRKNIEFYVERVACNMVVANKNGEVELIKKRSCMDSEADTPATVAESPNAAAIANCSATVISERLKKQIRNLKPKSRGKHDKEMKNLETD